MPVLDKFSSRSVYLSVYPIQFAFYLRLRVVFDQWQWNKRSIVKIYIDNFNQHIKQSEWLEMVVGVLIPSYCMLLNHYVNTITMYHYVQ